MAARRFKLLDVPAPPAGAPASKADLFARLGAVRYAREQGGVILSGMPIATDDRAKLLLAGARIKAEADPNYVTRWKVVDNTRVEVSAALIVAMSDAVLAFVDKCFSCEATVADAIQAGTLTTLAEVEAAFADAMA